MIDAARRRDEGRNVSTEASCCKMFATEMVGRVADRAVQVHGGAGYMSEYAVERFYRDVRLFRIYEGTTQIQQLLFGHYEAFELVARQRAFEVELVVQLHLAGPLDEVLDRVLDGDDVDARIHDRLDGRQLRGRLTRTGRTGEDDDALRLADRLQEVVPGRFGHPEGVDAGTGVGTTQDTNDDRFEFGPQIGAVDRHGRETEADHLIVDHPLGETVLGKELLEPVEVLAAVLDDRDDRLGAHVGDAQLPRHGLHRRRVIATEQTQPDTLLLQGLQQTPCART